MSWAGKKVLVLGAGESGLSMARHLASAGASLVVADTREQPPGAQAIVDAVPGIETAWGAFSPALFEGVDAVAVSPGVPVSGPLADAAVLEAKGRGLSFVGDVELFALALAEEKEASGYTPKILAITGTNGKTTVTSLTTFLANRAGKRATYAGNISPAALDAWHAAKAAGSLPEIWVLELSSYQLETTHTLKPDTAVMLNLTEDHLDRHGSMQDYAAAKARIFATGALQILNRDDPASLAMRRPFVPKGKKDAPPVVITFGTSEPQSEHEYGLQREARPGGLTWLTEGTPDGAKRLMPAEVLRIKGQHNALNALAALALTRSLGLPLAPMLKALGEYKGEAHRVQPVAEVGGITYIDDSKGTNVGATLAALNGLGSELRDGRKLVLIAGGDGKGQDFEPLAVPVAVYCRAVMLIGRDAPALEEKLKDGGVALMRCDSLEAAVRAAAQAAQAGDIVLLSPACASLDMFRNYGHRAEVFVEAVRELGRGVAANDAVAAGLPAAEAMVAEAPEPAVPEAQEPFAPVVEEAAAPVKESAAAPIEEVRAQVAAEVPEPEAADTSRSSVGDVPAQPVEHAPEQAAEHAPEQRSAEASAQTEEASGQSAVEATAPSVDDAPVPRAADADPLLADDTPATDADTPPADDDTPAAPGEGGRHG